MEVAANRVASFYSGAWGLARTPSPNGRYPLSQPPLSLSLTIYRLPDCQLLFAVRSLDPGGSAALLLRLLMFSDPFLGFVPAPEWREQRFVSRFRMGSTILLSAKCILFCEFFRVGTIDCIHDLAVNAHRSLSHVTAQASEDTQFLRSCSALTGQAASWHCDSLCGRGGLQ